MQRLAFAVAALWLPACGAGVPSEVYRPSISPQDFVLVPCGPKLMERPCTLMIAGGKRVLFGAPAGVAATLTMEDLRGLDAVMLFSLRASDIEGLDEIRNESWRAGRSVPLRVVGPEGTVGAVEALNKVFEQADALRIVEEGIPRGGYDAAVLEGFELPPRAADATVFDTGDVRIRLFKATYVAEYIDYHDGEREQNLALLTGCGQTLPLDTAFDAQGALISISCLDDADVSWPLTETVFVKKAP